MKKFTLKNPDGTEVVLDQDELVIGYNNSEISRSWLAKPQGSPNWTRVGILIGIESAESVEHKLIQCPICSKDISPFAISCPQCGHPLKPFPSDIRPTDTIESHLQRTPAMKLCPQCNTKCLNTEVRCCCGYSFQDEPAAFNPHFPQSAPQPGAPSVSACPDFLDINWDRVLIIWWSFAWRSAVFGVLISLFLGLGVGFLVGFAGHAELDPAVVLVLSWLGSIPVSIVILRVVLLKKFPEFSVRLIRSR